MSLLKHEPDSFRPLQVKSQLRGECQVSVVGGYLIEDLLIRLDVSASGCGGEVVLTSGLASSGIHLEAMLTGCAIARMDSQACE